MSVFKDGKTSNETSLVPERYWLCLKRTSLGTVKGLKNRRREGGGRKKGVKEEGMLFREFNVSCLKTFYSRLYIILYYIMLLGVDFQYRKYFLNCSYNVLRVKCLRLILIFHVLFLRTPVFRSTTIFVWSFMSSHRLEKEVVMVIILLFETLNDTLIDFKRLPSNFVISSPYIIFVKIERRDCT